MRSRTNDHITPHHAWNYLHADSEMSTAEHDHILECEACLRLFLLCLKSDSFGTVLKSLNLPEARRTA
jgi:hypothetical protein